MKRFQQRFEHGPCGRAALILASDYHSVTPHAAQGPERCGAREIVKLEDAAFLVGETPLLSTEQAGTMRHVAPPGVDGTRGGAGDQG